MIGVRVDRTVISAVRDRVAVVGGDAPAVGVLEAYITLWLLLGARPPFVIAFIVEAAGRLLTVVFKFVPLQMGVSEAGTAFLTGVLGLGTTLGTKLGLVRKVRMICWTGVGTVLLVRRGLSAAVPSASTANLSTTSTGS